MRGRPPRQLVFLLLAILGAMTLGPWACRKRERAMIAARCREVRARVLARAGALPSSERAALQRGLDEAVRLAEDGHLTFMALKTLEGRTATILADERLTASEATHLGSLLVDLPAWTDESMAFRYIGGR